MARRTADIPDPCFYYLRHRTGVSGCYGHTSDLAPSRLSSLVSHTRTEPQTDVVRLEPADSISSFASDLHLGTQIKRSLPTHFPQIVARSSSQGCGRTKLLTRNA